MVFIPSVSCEQRRKSQPSVLMAYTCNFSSTLVSHPRIIPQDSFLLDIQISSPQTPFSHESLPPHNPLLLLRFLTMTSVSRVPYWHGLVLSIVSVGIEIDNLSLCEFLTSYQMSISAVTLFQRRKKSAINWKFLLHIFYIWIISDLDRNYISRNLEYYAPRFY